VQILVENVVENFPGNSLRLGRHLGLHWLTFFSELLLVFEAFDLSMHKCFAYLHHAWIPSAILCPFLCQMYVIQDVMKDVKMPVDL
jgi:hypothetical protein